MIGTSPLVAQQNLATCDGELYLLRGFYPAPMADRDFQELLATLAWQTEQLSLFGRWVTVPRLIAWYGEANARYRYSGLDHTPLPWTETLLRIKQDTEQVCQHSFNSVLANLYRDGRDSMGCHADNERALGLNPVIASVSLGDSRILRFRHPVAGHKLDLELCHGDLLVMAGALQHHWRHELPKTRRIKQARINLTYRQVLAQPI